MAECKPNPMGYLPWMSRSEELHRKGVKQMRCPTCKKFYWPFERKQHVLPAEAAGGRYAGRERSVA